MSSKESVESLHLESAYLTAERKPPADVDTLRQWIASTAKPR